MATAPKKKSSKKKPASRKSKRGWSIGQLISLAVALSILIAISATTTLMLTGAITIYEPGVGAIPSISEASVLCDKEIRKTQDNLRSLHLDSRSSRYHPPSSRYKLFYEIDVFSGKSQQEGVSIFYVNCFVDSVRGRVTNFELFEQKDYKPPAQRNRGGNTFGL